MAHIDSIPFFRRNILAAAVAAACALLAPNAAWARPDDVFGSSRHVEAMDDAELDTLRGRYSGPTGVVAIGIDLRSIWQTPDGTQLSASAAITANASELNRGEVRISTQASVTPGTGSSTVPPSTSSIDSTRRITGTDPTRQAGGLVQAVQLAGDRNTAFNRLQVDMLGNSQEPPAVAGASDARIATASLPNGTRASASVAQGGLQVDLRVANVGTASQRVGTDIDSPGIKQSIRIASDGHAVQNDASLRLTLAPTTARSMVLDSVMRSISSVIGLKR